MNRREELPVIIEGETSFEMALRYARQRNYPPKSLRAKALEYNILSFGKYLILKNGDVIMWSNAYIDHQIQIPPEGIVVSAGEFLIQAPSQTPGSEDVIAKGSAASIGLRPAAGDGERLKRYLQSL